MLGIDCHVDSKVAAKITDRVPSQNQPDKKQTETENVKAARIWQGRAGGKPNHFDPQKKADDDHGPKNVKGISVAGQRPRPLPSGPRRNALATHLDGAQPVMIS